MLVSAVVAGLLAGIATKGKLTNLASARIRWFHLFVVAVGLHLGALLPLDAQLQRGAYVLSLLVLVAVSVRNWRLFGAPLVAVGLAFNATAVASTGGAMPVAAEAILASGTKAPSDPLHVVSAHAFPLGDVVPVPSVGVYSVGDIVLALGTFLLIVGLMRAAS